MKAVIKYPAFGQEAYWKRGDDQTRFCYVTVTTPDGLSYRVKVTEGTPQWTAKAGDAIDIEIKDAPADGKAGFAYVAGQAPPKKFGNGQPYQRREWKTPTPENAKEAADFTANLFKAMKGRLPELESDSVALLVGKLIEKLC
jgi:hypothetical protein